MSGKEGRRAVAAAPWFSDADPWARDVVTWSKKAVPFAVETRMGEVGCTTGGGVCGMCGGGGSTGAVGRYTGSRSGFMGVLWCTTGAEG